MQLANVSTKPKIEPTPHDIEDINHTRMTLATACRLIDTEAADVGQRRTWQHHCTMVTLNTIGSKYQLMSELLATFNDSSNATVDIQHHGSIEIQGHESTDIQHQEMQPEIKNAHQTADKRDIASAIEHTLYGFDVVIAQSLDCIHQELALNMDNETPNHVHHGPTTPIDHLVYPALEQKHVPDDPLSQLHEDVLQDLKESTGQILDDLRTYHRSRHELVLMFHDIPQDKAVQCALSM
jgi:hypothetical protein